MDTENEFIEAVKAGRLEQVRGMLERDPRLASARSQNGSPAVVLATYYGRHAVADLLVERGAPLDIFSAAMTGQVKRVRELLDEQPELAEAVAPDGFQPLGLASFFGRLETARRLLDRGAQVNSASRNDQRVAPLNSAAAGGHLEVARLLLEHGADPNARQEGGFTPLHSAAQNGQLEMVKLLVDHGAQVEARSEDGRTALDYALESGRPEVLHYLKGETSK